MSLPARPPIGVFISLEGLSGVGKTNLARIVADKIGGQFFHTTVHFDRAKQIMDRAEDVNSRLCLFAAAMLHSSNRVSDLLRRGTSVVVDGLLARTIAYHRGMGATISIDYGDAIRWPDYSIMLICNEEERKRRISERNRPRTLWDDIEDRNIDQIRLEYQAFEFPVVQTAFRLADAVAEEVLQKCGIPPSSGAT